MDDFLWSAEDIAKLRATNAFIANEPADRIKWLQDRIAGLALGSRLRRRYEDELWSLQETIVLQHPVTKKDVVVDTRTGRIVGIRDRPATTTKPAP